MYIDQYFNIKYRVNLLTNILITEYEFCKPQKRTNWISISDAKRKCFEDNDCYMFYDRCGNGKEFRRCTYGAQILSSSCGSILYKTGNGLKLFITSIIFKCN